MKKQTYWEDISIGQDIPSLTKVATTLTLVKWAGAYGDYNPLHYENDFAVNFMKTKCWLVKMKIKS